MVPCAQESDDNFVRLLEFPLCGKHQFPAVTQSFCHLLHHSLVTTTAPAILEIDFQAVDAMHFDAPEDSSSCSEQRESVLSPFRNGSIRMYSHVMVAMERSGVEIPMFVVPCAGIKGNAQPLVLLFEPQDTLGVFLMGGGSSFASGRR